MTETSRTIFIALNKVAIDLAKEGIGKNQVNAYDKYNFRGIDDVLNTLGPILAHHGVLIIPAVVDHEVRQVPTAKGGSANHATLVVKYHFYDLAGDSIVHEVVGEAMDRGDKALNKALTAAYKYLVFQAFAIPLVGDDADAETHQITRDIPAKPESSLPPANHENPGQISHLIAATDTDVSQFCQWLCGVNTVPEIPVSEMPRALEALNKKLDRMEVFSETTKEPA